MTNLERKQKGMPYCYGVPCKVIREIGEKDREYYYKGSKLDVWE